MWLGQACALYISCKHIGSSRQCAEDRHDIRFPAGIQGAVGSMLKTGMSVAGGSRQCA